MLTIIAKLKDYCLVEIPKWDRDFDIYGTNEIAEETDSLYAVVGQGGEDIRRKSWIARLHYSSYTGFWGDMKRWSSRKHRMMYIGAMPEV